MKLRLVIACLFVSGCARQPVMTEHGPCWYWAVAKEAQLKREGAKDIRRVSFDWKRGFDSDRHTVTEFTLNGIRFICDSDKTLPATGNDIETQLAAFSNATVDRIFDAPYP